MRRLSRMTVGITGHRRRAPWRGAVVGLIIIAAVGAICLILLGLAGDFLVDWLWFSTIGYLGVFWTTIAAEGEIFFAVFVATALGSDAANSAVAEMRRHAYGVVAVIHPHNSRPT
jgi:uncharacterized membrane protein (UPF0182 family)